MAKLTPHPTAIHGEDGPGHVVRRARGKEDSGAGEVFGLPPASGRNPLEDLSAACLVRLQCLRVRGREVAGSNGIHLDTMRSPLVRQRLRKLRDAALARGVGRDSDPPLKAQQRGDVDDLAGGVARDHVAGGALAQLEDARQIHLEDLLPIGQRDILSGTAMDRAGVVDEDIDASEVIFDLAEELQCARFTSEVGAKCARIASDLRRCLGGGTAVSVQSDGRAGLRKSLRDRGAKAAGRTCNKRRLTIETKEIENICHGGIMAYQRTSDLPAQRSLHTYRRNAVRIACAGIALSLTTLTQAQTYKAPVVPAAVQPSSGVEYRSDASLQTLAAQLMAAAKLAPSGNVSVTLDKVPTHFTMLSVRVASGGAEFHKSYSDIFIVVDGEATEITGGTIVDPKIAGDEIRGVRIEGGASQILHKGDVIMIPPNTPHQTTVAPGNTFTYFVVKVLSPTRS